MKGVAVMMLSLSLCAAAVLYRACATHTDALHYLLQLGRTRASGVLVLYVYSNTDPEYINNLKFFLREGVHPADGLDYWFIVNRDAQEVCVQSSNASHQVYFLCVYLAY